MHFLKAAWKRASIEWIFICLLFVITSCGSSHVEPPPETYGFGRPATTAEIAAWDIDIDPSGEGLPAGSGTVAEGREIYAIKCSPCHGTTGNEGPQSKLVGAMGDTTKAKTIGNYWPYATTLFDYIRRTMPYTTPGSLQNDEVYSLVAFLLHANKIIDSTAVMQKESLAAIKMPALEKFVNDDRQGGPEVK